MEEHDVTVNVNLTKLSSFLLSSVAMTSKSETSGAIQSVDQEGYTQTFTMVNNECGNGQEVLHEWGNTTINIIRRMVPRLLQWWTLANHKKANAAVML